MSKEKSVQAKKTFERFTDISRFKTDPFGQNISGSQAFKRTERIIIAIYILTNSISEDEPVRMRVRYLTHDLLSEVLTLRTGLRAAGDERIDAISAVARELISLVWILYVGGFVSKHNAEIVMQAIDDLGEFVNNARASYLSEHITLSKQDMTPTSSSSSARARKDKDIHSVDSADNKHQTSSSKRQNVRYNEQNRQSVILDVLRNSGELGIKDISSQVVGCSEKTVQRELLILISKGLVHKKGKKRWSIYTII